MIGYDLRYLPLAIGDFTDYMQVGVLRNDPDIAFYFDPENPSAGDPRLRHVRRDNFAEVIKPFMSLTDQLFCTRFDYDWPTENLRGNYLFYHIYNKIFSQGVKPLRFKSAAWAEKFMAEHGTKYVVHLRKSPNAFNSNRNSDYAAWREFFLRSKEKFMLLGEVPHSCRLDNTVVAKDYGTTIEQDLAIAAAADAFLGVPSGMAGAVLFNDKPYKIFKPTLNPKRCLVYKIRGGVGRWDWAKKDQEYLVGAETVERIERAFAECSR